MVPVYSAEDPQDIFIRAYSKCATYQANLTAWFGTSEFLNKSDSSKALRASIQSIAPSLNTSLANWWCVGGGDQLLCWLAEHPFR